MHIYFRMLYKLDQSVLSYAHRKEKKTSSYMKWKINGFKREFRGRRLGSYYAQQCRMVKVLRHPGTLIQP